MLRLIHQAIARIALTAHHLVCDGKSSGLLLRDLAALYNAARYGLPAPPPEVAPYDEYVRAAAAPPPVDAEQYWVERFAEPAPPLDLPTDRPRPPEKTFRASQARVQIDGAEYASIKQLAARHGCTLYVALLTAWNVLLHRLTSQSDIVVGVPMSGLVDDAKVVGHSVHMLPLRTAVDPHASFAQQLALVRRVVADAHEHRGVTFGRLVRMLAPARDASRPTLFSVVFNVDPRRCRGSIGCGSSG